ncbi:MAG: acetyl-CoA carboxylase biotin carboxyl carrier protein [Bryobacteraceae bacterium]
MTNEEIKELIQIFTDSGLGEMEVQRGENRLRMRRSLGVNTEMLIPQVISPILSQAAPPATTAPLHPAAAAPASKEIPPGPEPVLVKAPIVGTYYDAPAPGSPTFVKVGDAVEPGQVLCIIESMKLMNEIESDIAGTIVSKFLENGKAVEYGESLFAIEPR